MKTRAPEAVIRPEQVLAFRLARHQLLERAPPSRLLQVLRRLVGVQCQVPAAAALSLWARVEGVTPERVEHWVYRARTATRAWSLRGTAHLMARQDHPLLIATVAETGGIGRALARRGLDAAGYERIRSAVLSVLEAGPCTRADITAGVAGVASPDLFGSWGGVLRVMSQRGDLVFGPPRGSVTTFVRTDRFWTSAPPRTPESPVTVLLERYLRAFGPATTADFTYWSGLGKSAADAALAELGARACPVAVSGKRMFVLRADLRALTLAKRARSVRLLPHFDVWLLGHRDKSLWLDHDKKSAVFREAGWVSPTILLDGQASGVWSYTRRGDLLDVRLEPWSRIDRSTRSGLEREASRLASALGLRRYSCK